MIVSIAAAVIVAALAVFLTRHTHASAPPPKPVSPGAQEAYLKGLYHFSRRTTPDFRKAEEYFRSAVEQEPRFARAWANLANVYGFLGESPRAKIAAQRALEIDERTAEAHAALGLTSLLYDFDWPSADRHFKRAIELDPSYATAHHWYAFDLVAHRKFDAALREIERARKLDPTSLIINTDVAQILLYARRYDQAIAKAREVVALDSNFEQAHQVLTEAYLRSGDRESATDELRSHPNPCLSGKLAADIGDKSEALALLHQMEQMFHRNQQLGVDFLIARLQAMVGNDESSIDWLEKSLALHDANVAMVAVDPSFDSLRGRQRFQAFLRRMKLSESLD